MSLNWSLLLALLAGAGNEGAHPSRLAHTYSIVAYDGESKTMGVAVQSHWFSVGSIVGWAQAGVGAVATQSFVKVDYGPAGLEGMASGEAPHALLQRLVSEDAGRDVRQVAYVDASGRVSAHTGSKCIRYACDAQGRGFSVQANMMLKSTVCQAMKSAFEKSKGSLARRLLAALEAAEGEGGDIRGRQSAALKVVSADKPQHPWQGVVTDLRVDDHVEPLQELKRLLGVSEAYDAMNQGDLAIEHQKLDEALAYYRQAESMLPGRLEPRFWHAVQLASTGRLERSLPIFREVFSKESNWLELAKRLVEVGLLPDDPKVIEAIAAQGRK